jgi:uncharacterized protein YjbJ (UPF0337 family)
MNSQTLKGNWEQIKGRLKAKWSKLTDDDIGYISGRREELAGKLRERYGWKKDEADRNIDEFIDTL